MPALEFDPVDGIAEVSGRLSGADAATYGFTARAGQRLRADIGSESGLASFDIFGPGGGVIAEDRRGLAGLVLDRDGAYAVRVSLIGNGGAAGYVLTVELDDAAGAGDAPPAAVAAEPAGVPEIAAGGDDEKPATVAGAEPDAAPAPAGGAVTGAGDAPAAAVAGDAPDATPAPADAAETGFWQVAGLGGDPLNVRGRPEPGAVVVAQVAEGRVLRDLGCQGAGETRWCRVEAPDDDRVRGWVAARFLRPAPAPAAGPLRPRWRP